MRWIAVAALIIVIGGIGGFLFLNKKDGNKKSGQKTPNVQSPKPAVGTTNTPTKKPPAMIAKPVKVSIETTPADATVRVRETDLEQKSPATFSLDDTKTYKVEVSKSGFVSVVVDVVAGENVNETVKLEAKGRVIRFNSNPTGALVLVNGRKLAGRTPTELPLTGRYSKAKSVNVAMRMPGHRAFITKVNLQEGFVEDETAMALPVIGTLEQVQRATRSRQQSSPSPSSPMPADAASSSGTTPKDAPPKDSPPPTPTADPTPAEPAKPATPVEPKIVEPTVSEPSSNWIR